MIDERVPPEIRSRLLRHRSDWREAWAGPGGDESPPIAVFPPEEADALGLTPLAVEGELSVSSVLEPLRARPSHRAEMISELRAGERLRRLTQEGDWLLVAGEDDYVGWVHSWVATDYAAGASVVGRFAAPLGTLWISDHFAASPLMLGSPLLAVDAPLTERGGMCLVASVDGGEGWLPREQMAHFGREDSVSISALLGWGRSLLGTPYRWGGRSPFGFDCSAFVQYLAQLALRRLPRDAAQQVEHGEEVPLAGNAFERGDLLFFGDPVDHVAIYSGKGRILHCSGRVREETLGENPQLAARLCAARRPWDQLELVPPTLWGARVEAQEGA